MRRPIELLIAGIFGALVLSTPGQAQSSHATANQALLAASYSINGPRTKEANAALDQGAEVDVRDDTGTTALLRILSCYPQHEAGEAMLQTQTDREENDLRQLVQRMLKAGANVNAQDQTGKTALMLALQTADPGLIDMILQRRPKIEAVNHLGQTALFVAAGWKENFSPYYQDVRQKAMCDQVRILIAKGARVNRRDKSGKSALDLATKAGNTEVVSVLRTAERRHRSH